MGGTRCIDCDCCEFLLPHMDDGRCLSCHLDFKQSTKSTYRPNDRSDRTSSSSDATTPSSSCACHKIHPTYRNGGKDWCTNCDGLV